MTTFFASWPIWPFNIGAIIAGPLLLRDTSAWATANPDWAGPISLLPATVWIAFLASVIGLVVVNWCRSTTKESYRELQSRAARAQELENTIAENIAEIMNGIIAGFGNQLKLGPEENSRISIYVDNSSDGLISIGRVATNPNHRPIGRRVLSKDEGCVGRAWADAWVIETNFGIENYESHVSHFGMEQEVINGLGMKPLYLAALRIDDGPHSLAVLVFESLQADRFDEAKIRREMSAFSGYLIGTLKTLQPHMPKPLGVSGEEL